MKILPKLSRPLLLFGCIAISAVLFLYWTTLPGKEINIVPGIVKKIEHSKGVMTILGLDEGGEVKEITVRIHPDIRKQSTWENLRIGKGVDIHLVTIQKKQFARSLLPRGKAAIPPLLRERAEEEGISLIN